MGGEGEIKTKGYCEVENTVYVAVGKNKEEGKSLLLWAVNNFAGKSVCLLHAHRPNRLTQLVNGKLSSRRLKWKAVVTYQELEYQQMNELLDQYLLFLEQMAVRSGKVWIVTDNIEEGIVQVIAQHGVRMLVMGAASEEYSQKFSVELIRYPLDCGELSTLKSTKAFFVFQKAPVSCQIWFSCKGYLINTRSNSMSLDLASIDMLPCERNNAATLLCAHDTRDLKSFKSLKCKGSSVDGGDTPFLMIGEKMADGLTLFSRSKSEDLTSSMGLKGHLAPSTHHELEHIMAEAINSKQRAFEESVRRWRAEEDAVEAMQLARVSESLCSEEIKRNKEIEELLVRQRQDLEILKDQHDQILKELQTIQDQMPGLETQIAENCYLEDELEKKIIQAVTLLISFKEKRDLLQIERDDAIATATRLRKLVEKEDTKLRFLQIFAFSFSDIVEATKNFDPSLKIGEGRFGTVYKGIINHVVVAIKMLPFSGSLSDLEFKRRAEVLSRVRHPNLVTIYGICTESRSLIYEYLENGSLEDYMTGSKLNPLPWQIRIGVVVEICSVLIFLHKNNNAVVLGNLRPDQILLDANFVSKLRDLGIHLLASENGNVKAGHKDINELEALSYLDPDATENGQFSSESDTYSFGILVLRLLTTRPASNVVRDVRCAINVGNLSTVLDYSAGDWPPKQANELALLALRCCEEKQMNRPDLAAEVWPVMESMRDFCSCSPLHSTSSLNSQGQHRIPPHFVCPILQEVMKDPYIAADGFTYEADAIKGWLESGHKTSPMTNLELEHCDLLPNYALYYAIQEWLDQC